MKRMNRLISSIFQSRGRATCSSSTTSTGMGLVKSRTGDCWSTPGSGPPDERKKGACSQHVGHISKVGTCSHPDILEHVREDIPAFDHAPSPRLEAETHLAIAKLSETTALGPLSEPRTRPSVMSARGRVSGIPWSSHRWPAQNVQMQHQPASQQRPKSLP
jgi:hypothetical protein